MLAHELAHELEHECFVVVAVVFVVVMVEVATVEPETWVDPSAKGLAYLNFETQKSLEDCFRTWHC